MSKERSVETRGAGACAGSAHAPKGCGAGTIPDAEGGAEMDAAPVGASEGAGAEEAEAEAAGAGFCFGTEGRGGGGGGGREPSCRAASVSGEVGMGSAGGARALRLHEEW